jgi:hypothetical protein
MSYTDSGLIGIGAQPWSVTWKSREETQLSTLSEQVRDEALLW